MENMHQIAWRVKIPGIIPLNNIACCIQILAKLSNYALISYILITGNLFNDKNYNNN